MLALAGAHIAHLARCTTNQSSVFKATPGTADECRPGRFVKPQGHAQRQEASSPSQIVRKDFKILYTLLIRYH
jgi:hypothetical protein